MSALILESLACQIAWAPNRRLFAKIRVSILLICKPYLSRCSSLMSGWVIIFSSLVLKSSVTSALTKFMFALSVLSVGVGNTNFNLANYSRIYPLSFPISSSIPELSTIESWVVSSNVQNHLVVFLCRKNILGKHITTLAAGK